jgi:heat-inducible transcriptional repressor
MANASPQAGRLLTGVVDTVPLTRLALKDEAGRMASRRQITLSDLPKRMRAILVAVLEEYIETARPVASRSAVARSGLDISPATARGAMGELAELELLMQPHTSAGRIPTEAAFRLYVDALMQRDLDREVEAPALADLDPAWSGDLDELIRGAAQDLSLSTGQLGFFIGAPADRLVIRQLHFVRVSTETVMALLVSTTGLVQSRLVRESESDARTLERVSGRLSELVAGLTLVEARTRLASVIEEVRAHGDALWRKVFELGQAGFIRAAAAEVYLGSQQLLLEQPEFSDVENLRDVLAMLDERERMMRLIEQTLQAEVVSVAIGAELGELGVTGCALVTASLGAPPPAGGLGVIGPVRMRYDRVIPAVQKVSKRISDYFV